MKKNIFVIATIILLLVTVSISSTNAQRIQTNVFSQYKESVETTENSGNAITVGYGPTPTYSGRIYGYTTRIISSSMVSVSVLCLVRVKAVDGGITRWGISFGSYSISDLPIGHDYTVAAAPMYSDLVEIVTLSSDEPTAKVDFTF